MPKAAKVTAIILVCLALLFCVGSYLLDRSLLSQTYARYTPSGPSLMLTDEDIAQDYPYQDVSFQLDGYTLRGHVYGDTPDARGLVVFRHGIFSQHQDYLSLIIALVDRGWKVFAYDAIGCGESDGDSVLGFAQSPIDVHAAIVFAQESGMADDLPILLFGHSWGGYGVAGALDYDDGVAGCVSMSGFDTPQDIIMESAQAQMGALAITQAPTIGLIGWMDFGPDAGRSAAQAVSNASVPVLIIHGTEDTVINYDGASIIAEREAISNEAVRYITKSDPGRAGHNSYFYSPEAQEYLAECASMLEELQEQNGGEIPQDKLDAFLAGIDKRRANTADPVLVDEIDSFLSSCL